MKKIILSALCFSLLFGSFVSAQEASSLPNCPTSSDIKSCKTLGIFNRSSTFQAYQITAKNLCDYSKTGLDFFNNTLKQESKNLNQKFTYAVTIFNNTADGCSKSEFENSAKIFTEVYDEVENFTIDKINQDRSEGNVTFSEDTKKKFLALDLPASLLDRFKALIENGDFNSIPESKNIFASGDGKILGYESNLRDYTGEGTSANSQFRSTLNKLFDGMKKILIPISIFLIVFAGVQLFLISRSGVAEEIPKKRNQVFNILIGWSIFSVAVTIVDFVIFGNARGDGENFIFRDNFNGENYSIDEGRSQEFAQRIFGETEGFVDFLLTLFVIISILFLIISAIRLIFGDEESYEATKKQVIQSIIATVVAVSLKPLLNLFYQNGKVVRPDSISIIEFFAKWADYVLGFIGILAAISLIYGGIKLVINYGNGEAMDEAKKIIMYSVIGVILAFSTWTIINFFADPVSSGTITQNIFIMIG